MTSRLSRHTLLLLVSNIGGAGLSFVLSVLIGRALGDEGLGAYSVILAWVVPLSLVVECGLATLATRDLARDAATSTAWLHTMARARMLIGGLAVLVLVLFAPRLSANPAAVVGIVLSAPLVVMLPLYTSFTAVFKARGAMYPIPWLNIGMLAAQVVLTAWVLANGGGLVEVVIVNVVTSAGQLLAAWALWARRFAMQTGGTPASPIPLAPLMRRALPFALAALFAALQTRVSLILLEHLTTTADVGYFAAANRIVEAGRMIPNAFFGALFPALSMLALQPILMQQTFRRAMLGLGAFGLLAALITFVLAPMLITLTYGSTFAPAAPVLQVLMASLVFSLLRGGRTLYWYALGREQQVNVVNGAVILMQIILSLLLIPAYGTIGAAWALFVAEAAALVLLWRDSLLPAPRVLTLDRL